MDRKLCCSCFLLLCVAIVTSIDLTLEPNANGPEVVEAVINLIRQNCLFVEDKLLLRRLAYVLTDDGQHFRYGLQRAGGIWGISPGMLVASQAHGDPLNGLHSIIQSSFGIDWSTVQMSSMTKPLYSGLAAVLFIQAVGGAVVPWNIEDQAKFVVEHYNSNVNSHEFLVYSQLLDKGCHRNKQIDMVFIIDDSTSLTTGDFQRTKDFLVSLVKSFNISRSITQVALIKFDASAHLEFNLNTHSTAAEVEAAIVGLQYTSGSTDTADALTLATTDVFYPASGGRHYAAKVAIVITDGNSDDKYNTQDAAAAMHEHGVVTFAIGVGDKVDVSELNTIGSYPHCTHVYQLTDYSQIRLIKEEIQQKSCNAPFYTNETVICIAKECPVVAFPVSSNGLTVTSQVSCGEVAVYVSANNMNPGPESADMVVYVLTGETEQLVVGYLGSPDRPLFVSVSPLQSGDCTVTMTPCQGDCRPTDHSVHVYCEQDGRRKNCTENDLKPFCGDNHVTGFPNPCTAEELAKNHTRFPFPNATDKFIMCDLHGDAYVVYCPERKVYVPACEYCLAPEKINSTICSKTESLPGNIADPCTWEAIANNLLFHPYVPDATKFIHCDLWGDAFIVDCRPGEKWDQAVLTCVPQSTINPCLQGVVSGDCTGPYAYPGHPTMYIDCDPTCTIPYKRECAYPLIWDDTKKMCDFNIVG